MDKLDFVLNISMPNLGSNLDNINQYEKMHWLSEFGIEIFRNNEVEFVHLFEKLTLPKHFTLTDINFLE